MATEQTELIVEIVSENNGQLTRADVLDLFDASKRRGVAIGLGRLLGPSSDRLHEKDGLLFVSKAQPQQEQITVQSKDSIKSVGSFGLHPSYREEIDIPNVSKQNDAEVIFEVQLKVKSVKRIGLANSQNVRSVVWMPIGSSILKASIGSDPKTGNELLGTNFLVLVRRENGSYYAEFFAPPAGESFVLAWE